MRESDMVLLEGESHSLTHQSLNVSDLNSQRESV